LSFFARFLPWMPERWLMCIFAGEDCLDCIEAVLFGKQPLCASCECRREKNDRIFNGIELPTIMLKSLFL
jgi:hypothetical protein